MKFLIALSGGDVKFLGVRFGKDVAEILAEEIRKQRNGKEIKAAIGHAASPKLATELKEKLEKQPKTKVLFISSVSSVVGTHTGPGTITVAFYPVE